MAGISVRNLRDDLSFGVRVTGITWETIADPEVRAQLVRLFKDRGMILFADLEDASPRMQVALSEVFGPLKDHPTATTERTAEDIAPGVIDMHHLPSDDPWKDEGIVEIDGKPVARFSPWHFDHCYQDELNLAGVLRCPVSTPEGGRTGFADGVELYQLLRPDLRARIEGLNVIYTLDTRLSQVRYGVNFKPISELKMVRQLLAEVARFPRALHPAVWTRADGRKVLHLGGWMADGLEGHEDPEGDALLDAVCKDINRLGEGSCAYWHQWQPTDMIIWDNHRMLHAVEGCDPKYERRTQRSTIKGDYGFGRFEGGKKIGEVNRKVAAWQE